MAKPATDLLSSTQLWRYYKKRAAAAAAASSVALGSYSDGRGRTDGERDQWKPNEDSEPE